MEIPKPEQKKRKKNPKDLNNSFPDSNLHTNKNNRRRPWFFFRGKNVIFQKKVFPNADKFWAEPKKPNVSLEKPGWATQLVNS